MRDEVFAEVRRLGGTKVVLSTNLALRLDGLPYASKGRIADPGVAIYFERRGKPLVLACDRWERIEDNLHALALTIDAMRGLERWGASDMLNRAFTGFAALPPPAAPSAPRTWAEVIGVDPGWTLAEIEQVYRNTMKTLHPDTSTGDHGRAAELNQAIREARAAKAGAA